MSDRAGMGLAAWRQRLRLWRVRFLRLEFRLVPSESQRLFGLTLVIGLVCGLAAVSFHLTIRALEGAGIERVMAFPSPAWILGLLALPVAGGLLCGALLQYVVPAARGSGIPQVKTAYAVGAGQVRLRDAVGKFIIGALQIGSGASLGREGPTVQICAGIASRLGRLFGVSSQSLRRLLPVGAAAGIAAAFNAPIAAVTFTIEEVVGTLDQTVLSGIVIAAALAAVVERGLLGEHPVFDVPSSYHLQSPTSLPLYAVMGVAAAGVAVVFTDMLLAVRLRSRKQSHFPAWMRPAAGGLVTGALAVVVFGLFGSAGVTGGGYATLGMALTGRLAVVTMVVLLFAKLAATAFSYGTGGAGGIFAPSLFMGGMLGGVFGALDISLLGHQPESLGAFALVGMGAVFAGIIRAPITSVLIIVEMTGGYSLILPLMIANMTAYLLARRLRPTPIYEALLEQDGVYLRRRMLLGALDGVRLDAIALGRKPVAFELTMHGTDLIKRSGENAERQAVYPVIDGAGRLVGLVTDEDLQIIIAEPDVGMVVNAADLMRPAVAVTLTDSLRTALELMETARVSQIPIVDADGRVVDLVDEAAIAHEYLRRSAMAAH